MIKHTPYAAFGKVALIVACTAGHIHRVGADAKERVLSGYYFYTKGRAKVKSLETGADLGERTPGYLNLSHDLSQNRGAPVGFLEVEFLEDTEWVCISKDYNAQLPNLVSVILTPGESTTLLKGTNLFLVKGQLAWQNTTAVGPAQMRVRSNDIVITNTSTETVYALIFS